MGNDIAYSGRVISADERLTKVRVNVEGLERVIAVRAPNNRSFALSAGQEIEIRSLKIAGRVQRGPREKRDYAIYALVPNGAVVTQRHIGTVRGAELYNAAGAAGVV